MELLLAVSIDGGPEVDVVLSVEPTHTVGAVTAALARHLRADAEPHPAETVDEPAGWLLSRPSTAETFDPGERIGGLGLITGDAIVVEPAVAARSVEGAPAGSDDVRPARGWFVEVSGGADAGRALPLDRSGTYVVGRDRTADLRLSDPGLGRADLLLRWAGDDELVVEPTAGVTVVVDGEPRRAPVVLRAGVALRCAGTVLELRHRIRPALANGDTSPTVALHRTRPDRPTLAPLALGPPTAAPDEEEPASFAYLAALMPLVMGVAMAIVFSPRFLLFAALSPLVAVAGYVDQRRRNRKRRRRAAARSASALAELCHQATEALRAERRHRRLHTPDVAELAHRVAIRSPSLWDADPGSAQIVVRVGIGSVVPLVEVRPPAGGEQAWREEAEERLRPLRRLIDVPVTVDLCRTPVVGLTGPDTVTTPLVASVVLQVSARHRPDEVIIAAAVAPGRAVAGWLPWLPHARPDPSPLGVPHLANDRPSGEQLVTALMDEVERRSTARSPGRPAVHRPHIVAVVDDALDLDPALVARLAALDADGGVSVLWLTSSRDRVLANAGLTIDCPLLTDRLPGRVHDPAVVEPMPFWPDGVTPSIARDMARGLGPLVCATLDATAALPPVVTLAEALDTDRFDARWVERQWRRSRRPGLAAPVGDGGRGRLVIDLVADGPHCLIGGTSGSGKSELTISMVAALLACHPPEHLNVLFVDYKGGATGEAFSRAPHTVGCVTNLDAALAQRALRSLRAELHRRMDLLRGRAPDLRRLAAVDPANAPPALVIVIDEFATLMAEVPAFMAGIVDLAQRGRSLGLHLLLATQRPAAAVSDNILANTNLRICLRTVDGAESSSVIGIPDAAAIDPARKGRGLLRRGPGEPQRFQAAWSGAPPARRQRQPPVEVRPFDGSRPSTSGGAAPGPAAPITGSHEPEGLEPSQLDELLAAMTAAAARRASAPARAPWLPELPNVVSLAEVNPEPVSGRLAVGLIDAPDEQARHRAVLDLESSGGLLVLGAGGSGKTTVLETVAAAATDPDGHGGRRETILFALDFAARQLTTLAAQPNCAAVATGDDLEAVTRIIAVLEGEVAQRRTGRVAATPLLLLVDDYGNAVQIFEGAGAPAGHHQWLERLNRIITDGRQVGLATVLTASRRAEVRASLWAAIGERLVLRCLDDSAYRDLGVDPSLLGPAPPPGRGVLGDGRLVQWALPLGAVPKPPVPERPSIRSCVPERLRVPPLPAELLPLPAPEAGGLRVRLGLVDLAAQPFELDLALDDLSVLGPPRSGRSTALAAVAAQLAANGCMVLACGPRRSPLATAGGVSRWFPVDANAHGSFDELADFVEGGVGDRRTALLVDGIDLLDQPALEAASARIAAARLPLAASAISLRGYGINPLWQRARNARSLLLLGPPEPLEAQDLAGVTVAVRPGIERRPGRALAVVDGRTLLVQIANAAPTPSVDVAPNLSANGSANAEVGPTVGADVLGGPVGPRPQARDRSGRLGGGDRVEEVLGRVGQGLTGPIV